VRARLRLSYAGVRFFFFYPLVADCSGSLEKWFSTKPHRIRVGRAIGVPTLLVDLIN
jgi:hypothetical protein